MICTVQLTTVYGVRRNAQKDSRNCRSDSVDQPPANPTNQPTAAVSDSFH